ncbi:DUF952 domain-containing protein [Rhodohalobacter sp. 614A]|uniref:DUF952 domain-containing protein n=1 Tax=Rhodohalobacter sp. 614A TaxID=2908649 RepID=UPI001F31AF27|nr:DUF952 domain-containing protein [Rhodohalobacter sp. 614A]
MSSNLIFHVVSKRQWQEFNQGGYFRPEGSRYEDGIACVKANKLKEYINEHFKGRRQVLLLVIDKARLVSKTEYNQEKEYILVQDKINMDSVLDKIFVKPNKEGIFDVDVTED